jgi:LPS export ABC transporter protein LptC
MVSYCCQLINRRIPYLMIFLLMVFHSCKNDIETINALTSDLKLPDQTAYNVEIAYTDSGLLRVKIFASEVNSYKNDDDPYVEFTKGIRALFYDSAENEESYIQAGYAIFYEKKEVWEGRNQVIAENPRKGERLETDQIFWDQKTEKIYSEKFSKITNSDGVFYGEHGFEARQDLSQWKLKGSSGTVNVKENQAANP